MDELEIQHRGLSYQGTGNFEISISRSRRERGVNMDGSSYSLVKPAYPFIRGHVRFRLPVTQRDLMEITDAIVKHRRPDGRTIVFEQAAMISAEPGIQRNDYEIHLVGQPSEENI